MRRTTLREQLTTADLTVAQRRYLAALLDLQDAEDAGVDTAPHQAERRTLYRALTSGERAGVQAWAEARMEEDRRALAQQVLAALGGKGES